MMHGNTKIKLETYYELMLILLSYFMMRYELLIVVQH